MKLLLELNLYGGAGLMALFLLLLLLLSLLLLLWEESDFLII